MNDRNNNLNFADKTVSALITFIIFISAFIIQFIISFMYMGMRIIAIICGAYKTGWTSEQMQQYVLKNIYSLTTELPDYDAVLFLIYLTSAIFFILLYYLLICRNIPLRTFVSKDRRLKPATILTVFICGTFMQVYISIALNNILPFFEKTMNNYTELLESITGTDSILSMVSVALLAPIAEELLFRGLIQKRLSKIMPVTAAIIIQAFLFGLYHLNIVQGIYAFLIGIVAGLLVRSYKTVKVSIILHIAINATSYLISYAPMQMFYNPMLAAIIFAFTFMTSLVLIIYMIRLHRSSQSNVPAPTEPQPSHAEAQEHNSLY